MIDAPKDFAKIFNTDIGQILVLIDESDDQLPEIKIIFKHDGLKYELKIDGFTDDENVWDRVQCHFERLDEKLIYQMVKKVLVSGNYVQE